MRATLTTQAQQQVLEPIAQQISQLIILEHEAEQNGVPMPDLSAAGEGVVGAVLNMVNIGREIGQTNDTELVEDMQRLPPLTAQTSVLSLLCSKHWNVFPL
eukprot:Colp12_sorted_trinity150504_noHs@19249